jgi:CBS domain-containing protein
MLLKDIMTCESVVVGPEITIRKAAEKMDDYDVGVLPVCDGGRLVGVLTDRDIVLRAIAAGRDPGSTPVREIMTARVVACYEDQDSDEAVQIMEQEQIRRLVVLDRQSRLVGIVSLGDLEATTGDDKLYRRVIYRVIAPAAKP